jgi:hypothetical protein
VTATTNNISVQVDFSSAVQKTDGSTLILGNVEGAPLYFEGGYVSEDQTTGAMKIVIDGRNYQTPRSNNTIIGDSLIEVFRAYESYPATHPVPRRCAGWKALAWFGVVPPAGKCDDGVILDMTNTLTMLSSAWTPILQAAGKTPLLPYNDIMVPPSEFPGGKAVTYILLNEPGFDIPGLTNWVFDVGQIMGQRAGTYCTAMGGSIQVSSHVASAATGDWVGLFKTSAADTSPTVKYYTSSCSTTAGTTASQRRACSLKYTPSQIDATASYELRLFAGGVRVAKGPHVFTADELFWPCDSLL